jgi:hypothetical protein
MTLCIAAKSRDEVGLAGVVCCFDAHISTDTYGSDTEIKLRHLPNCWGALYSGKQHRADELLGLLREVLQEEIIGNVLAALRVPVMQYKRNLVHEYLNATYGLGYEEFYSATHGHLSEEEVRSAIVGIKSLYTDCQLILFRIAGQSGDIYTVDYNFAVAQCSNFAAIGTGADTSLAWLHFRKQNVGTRVDQTIYNLFEAKKFANFAHAPGVGDRTRLIFLCSHEEMNVINERGLETLEKRYHRYGPREQAESRKFDLPNPCFHHFHWRQTNQERIGAQLDGRGAGPASKLLSAKPSHSEAPEQET